LHVFFFFDHQSVLKRSKLAISLVLRLGTNLLLFLPFELIPLLSFIFNLLLVLDHQLFFAEFKVLVDFIDTLAVLDLDGSLLLLDFLFSLGSNKRVVLLGAKDWPWSKGVRVRILLNVR